MLETDDKLPVLFYIHGGAFFGGDNQREEEEGSFVAQEQDIIVVKVLFQNPLYQIISYFIYWTWSFIKANYRLGVWGFWFHDEKESDQEYQGNWGLLDQRMALKWVFANIENFGGDPEKITISGCSAGGQSVWWHLVEEGSWPYFQKAISHSSPNGIPYFQVYLYLLFIIWCISEKSFLRQTKQSLFWKNLLSSLDVRKRSLLQKSTKSACVKKRQEKFMTLLGEQNYSFIKVSNLGLIFRILNRVHVGPWLQSVLQRKLTQMAEPYAPVIDGEAVTDDTFGMILEGIVEKFREKVTNQI